VLEEVVVRGGEGGEGMGGEEGGKEEEEYENE